MDHAANSLIMILDVVAFSKRSEDEQRTMVRHLVDSLRESQFFKARDNERRYLNSTGDGFVYAVSADGDFDVERQFCSLAEQLVDRAKTFALLDGNPMQVRIGLHVGHIVSGIVDGNGSFSVGAAINECSRLCDIAGPSQVVVSEKLAAQLATKHGEGACDNRLHPPPPTQPWQVVVKHSVEAQFRMLVGPHLSPAAPPKLVRLQEIHGHLRHGLEIVAESFVTALSEHDESLTNAMARIRPRLTIWVPDGRGGLKAIAPRVAFPASKFAAPERPIRTWPLGPPPAGPVAEAYVKGRLCVLLGLNPEHKTYHAKWDRRGVRPEVVNGFSRHAGGIIALPLNLFRTPRTGVLCIDTIDPLAGKTAIVRAVGEQISLRSSYFLASLVQLRGI